VDARWVEVKFLDEIETKVSRVFLLAIHSHLYSFALRFFFLQTHAISYSFFSVLQYTVKEKGEKPDTKPYPLPYCLRNPHRNLKSKKTLKIVPRNLKKLYDHEFGCRSRSTGKFSSRIFDISMFNLIFLLRQYSKRNQHGVWDHMLELNTV
jgi:hypothetical protein